MRNRSRCSYSFRMFKGGVHWIWYIGQPYEEKAQGRSYCCLQLPNGRMWDRTEPNLPQRCTMEEQEAVGTDWNKGSCNLVKGKKIPTNYHKGFQTQEGAQTGISILGDAQKSARQGPQHPVLCRLALNWRFGYMASLWRSLQTYVILCCCDLILDLHILNRILKKPIKSYNTCCTSWCIFLISTLKNTSTSCLYNPVN